MACKTMKERELWKGMLAGMAGGLVASWTMNQFQSELKKISEASKGERASEQNQNSGSSRNRKTRP